MNKRKSNLDEMQEQKLLKIEHNVAWFAFWGLLVAIIIQMVIGGEDFIRNIAGEWILFMSLCLYLGVACVKNGIWDRKLKPNLKTNIIVSLVSGAIFGLVLFVSTYLRGHDLLVSAAFWGIVFVITFILTIIALSITTLIYKRRLKKIEEGNES